MIEVIVAFVLVMIVLAGFTRLAVTVAGLVTRNSQNMQQVYTQVSEIWQMSEADAVSGSVMVDGIQIPVNIYKRDGMCFYEKRVE